MENKIICGDCLEVMRTMPENSVNAIVTDPPYHLTQVSRGGSPRNNDPETPFGRHHIGKRGFMGKTWDGGGISFKPETWAECLRVAKPGAHLLAFGGTRTFHRIACAIEDAGWEIRECCMYVYGSGFPKSLSVSKAIDRAAGIGREDKFEGSFKRFAGPTGNKKCDICGHWLVSGSPCLCPRPQDKAVSDSAKKWEGWGTSLKPSWEPIILARKPLEGTVVENVLKYGTGALNIDACRIPTVDNLGRPAVYYTKDNLGGAHMDARPWMQRKLDSGEPLRPETPNNPLGRWPANLILDGSEQVVEMFPHTKSGTGAVKRATGAGYSPNALGKESRPVGTPNIEYGDEGSAARFFYCAKSSKSERNDGLNGLKNSHPTVKPLALMTYLCKLITQPGGTILDPFCGSGSTGKAAIAEGFKFIGIEKESEYVEIARKRCGLNGARSLQELFDEVVKL